MFYKLNNNETFLISQKIVIVKDLKVLALKFPDSEEEGFRDMFCLPGGLLEMGESLSEGIHREVFEETGLKVEVGNVFAASDMFHPRFRFEDGRVLSVRFIEIGYHGKYLDGEVTLSSEHKSFHWLSREEIEPLRFAPDSREIIKTFLSLQISKF